MFSTSIDVWDLHLCSWDAVLRRLRLVRLCGMYACCFWDAIMGRLRPACMSGMMACCFWDAFSLVFYGRPRFISFPGTIAVCSPAFCFIPYEVQLHNGLGCAHGCMLRSTMLEGGEMCLGPFGPKHNRPSRGPGLVLPRGDSLLGSTRSRIRFTRIR